jgi:hypothetical protein
MIWFFIPYAFDRKLFEAWDRNMNLVTNPEDWICMMDGDVAFFRNDFGHHMQRYIEKYPDIALFSCYASRSGTPYMMPENNLFPEKNIVIHAMRAERCARKHAIEIEYLDKRVTGHLMCMQKATWLKSRESIKEKCSGRELYGIDTIVSIQILADGGKIGLMKGLYVFHYYRMLQGAKDKSHLI